MDVVCAVIQLGNPLPLPLPLPPLSLSLSLSIQLKVIAGLGTTIDVILRNGILKEGDTLVLTGADGPFTTQVEGGEKFIY